MAARNRLLVIDASLSDKLATELSLRGREAIACRALGVAGLEDPPLLRHLARLYAGQPWIMVTADDKMPAAHGDLIAALGVTVATIQGCRLKGKPAEHWKREAVHRWVHKMQEQEEQSIRRYSPRTAPRRWTAPRR